MLIQNKISILNCFYLNLGKLNTLKNKLLKQGFLFLFFALSTPPTLAIIIEEDPNPEDQNGYKYTSPRIEGDLSNFEGEKVVVLYRGTHLLESKFTQAQRLAMIDRDQVGLGMYASATYELGGLDYNDDDDSLLGFGQEVASYVNDLSETAEYTVKKRTFENQRYAFQELYSNNCAGFYGQLESPSGDYEDLFTDFPFTRNPLLSFSDRVKHPCKYGYGLKNYGSDTALLPYYDVNGRPKHPILGRLQGVILDAAAVEELTPMNVVRAHRAGFIKLSTHFRNDILSEGEVSIAGYVPGEYVVFDMPLQVPSFNHEYYDYYLEKYGLTKLRFNNFRKIFTSTTTSSALRSKKERELMGGLIEAARQDNNLTYKNCLNPSIPDLFDGELSRIDARTATITLDGDLE